MLKTQAHAEGVWHRNSHIWVLNSKNELLCHRRSAKVPTNPLNWEPFFGGHNAPGETEVQTAITELHEETGLEVDLALLTFKLQYRYEKGREFISVYTYPWEGVLEDLHVEKEEVIDLKWVSITELQGIITSSDPSWTRIGYEEKLLLTF